MGRSEYREINEPGKVSSGESVRGDWGALKLRLGVSPKILVRVSAI